MLKKYLLLIAVALMMVPAYLVERADALPVMPHALAAVAPASDVQPVYWRGRYYGGRGLLWQVARRRSLLWWRLVRYRTTLVRRPLVALWRRRLLADFPIGYVWVCG